jgi:hypothetical protein
MIKINNIVKRMIGEAVFFQGGVSFGFLGFLWNFFLFSYYLKDLIRISQDLLPEDPLYSFPLSFSHRLLSQSLFIPIPVSNSSFFNSMDDYMVEELDYEDNPWC